MIDYKNIFAGKRITVMGLGVLGRGVGDAEFLAQCGAQVIATDLRSEYELASSVEKLKQYPNISFHLGGHMGDDFTDTDLVIKAAGVPLDSPFIAMARKAHVPVAMSTALFAKYASDAGVQIVGVTGTRGKSTVSHMIFHALRQSSGQERRVFLGGNVRGVSTLAQLPEVEKGDIAILELDSWQLQGFRDLLLSPQIAIFTNLMPDHLNYYPDMEAYFEDKASIFRNQKNNDVLIVGQSVANRIYSADPPARPTVPGALPPDWHLLIPGVHNRENASLAAAALKALGLEESEIKQGLVTFGGVEGRLQLVGERNGVKIYNDNNSTTPEATIAALRALNDGFRKSIILIIGGSDKGLQLEELVEEIKKSVAYIILLAHPNYKGSARLAGLFKKKGIAYEEANSLTQAIGSAFAKASDGPILFSPALASFGMFKNEYDRGDQFLAAVKAHLS
ncbi:hypothetical protein HY970_03580 [Candidatus Kaiserbacteria bacterium]|nr:hypothetical protein [Candidatus Kaiserbacteria bacterium]